VNFTLGYDKAKVFNGGLFGFAFVMVEEEFVFTKSFKNQSGNMLVFLHALHEDEDVIEVNADDSFHDEVLEDVVHHSLEGGWRVSESEKHHQGFEKSAIHTKCCLPLIAFLHLDIVVTPLYIELHKVFRTVKLVDEFRNEGQGVPIFDHEGIQCSVVLHKAKSAILLLDEEDWRCHG
jgi:hypothetical protein